MLSLILMSLFACTPVEIDTGDTSIQYEDTAADTGEIHEPPVVTSYITRSYSTSTDNLRYVAVIISGSFESVTISITDKYTNSGMSEPHGALRINSYCASAIVLNKEDYQQYLPDFVPEYEFTITDEHGHVYVNRAYGWTGGAGFNIDDCS